MAHNVKLVLVKSLHTLIWFFFNVVIFYLLYAVITDQINYLVWICVGFLILEGITLMVFKSICPVTIWARRYSDSEKYNFDIYLPNWLARYNKAIYTPIVLVAFVILIYRLMT
jgi:hypothetical protein